MRTEILSSVVCVGVMVGAQGSDGSLIPHGRKGMGRGKVTVRGQFFFWNLPGWSMLTGHARWGLNQLRDADNQPGRGAGVVACPLHRPADVVHLRVCT